MITLACLTCHLALRTSGDVNEVDYLIGTRCEWYPDRYPCPRLGCEGLMTLTDTIASTEIQRLEMVDVSPQEAFQALMGMGLPAERECTPEKVLEALVGKKIAHIDAYLMPNTKRTVLNAIVLEDGHRIYLGASPAGPLVYRIAPPRSHVKELENV